MTDPPPVDPAPAQPPPAQPPPDPPPVEAPPAATVPPAAPAPAQAKASPARAERTWFDKRTKIALAIAAFEGLLLLLGNISKWVVLVIAIPCIGYYLWRGRQLKPGFGRDALWVLAVSQGLIILAAIVSFFIGTLILILLGVFIGVALLLIYLDDPSRRGG
jgi:hypothetical protein